MKLSIALAIVVTLASSTNALDDGTTPVAKEPLPVLRALAASSPRVSTYVLQIARISASQRHALTVARSTSALDASILQTLQGVSDVLQSRIDAVL